MIDYWSALSDKFNENREITLNFAIGGVILINFLLIWGIVSSLKTVSSAEKQAQQQLIKVPATLEVLNGSGKACFNDAVVEYLRKQGVDVVHSANYHASNVPSTIIIVRNGNPAPAYYIARLLSVDSAKVVRIFNKDYLVDATVIVGKDISSKKF